MPPKKKKDEDDLINCYDLIPKKFLNKQRNPNYDKHNITLPFLMGIYGGSGSGKGITLMNILKKMNGTFEKIVICVKTIEEPIYKWLQNRLPPDQVEFFENGEVPDPSKYSDPDVAKLIVFDDLMGVKNQSPMLEFFLRGRKLGFSMIYISQSFYKVPKPIRLQQNYIILKRLTSLKDLKLILSEYNLSQSKDEIIKIYRDITTKNKVDHIMIRTDEPTEKRFSKNFLSYIPLNDDA